MTVKSGKRLVTRGTRRKYSRKSFEFSKDMIPSQNGHGAHFVKMHREMAWGVYNNLPIPDSKLEAWRRTDIRSLEANSFKIVPKKNVGPSFKVPEDLLAPLVGDSHGGQIVISPNGALVNLKSELANEGVVFTDLSTAEKEYPKILEKIYGKIVSPDEGKFSAMVSAFAEDGILLFVPKNVVIEEPLHSVFWVPGIETAHFCRLLIYLEQGASVTFVHETASPTEEGGQTLVATIVEGSVGENANLRFVELQSLGRNSWNFSHERLKIEKNGFADWIFGAIGSHLTKNFSDLDLVGEGANGRMSGFYFTDKDQHLDHDTQQNHRAPHTTSDLLFKGALKDKSRSVWQGMIYVAPGAQKTDGYQANRNLILNSKARADSIPGLEILADDVRCTHGATIGKIDEELVFYLQNRGINRMDAERLIVEGFFDPIMQRIPYDGVRSRFEKAIREKMNS